MDNELITVLHKTREIETPMHTNTMILPNRMTYYEDMQYLTYPEVAYGTYFITRSGCVYSVATGLMLNYTINGMYKAINLRAAGGGRKTFNLHRLVAYQFCNPPIDYTHKIVTHIDGNKNNTNANNLQWVVSSAKPHSVEVHRAGDTSIANGHPNITDEFVHSLCREFVSGKSNTEIMKSLGMEIDNANHGLLRDIRGGYTWAHITSQYVFDKSSKKHAYTKEQKDEITEYIRQGKKDLEIFAIMNGRPYAGHSDNITSEYKTIYSLRKKESERIKKLGVQNG